MAGRKTPARSGRATDSYLALVRRFPLRPIRSEAELDAALAVIDALTDRAALDPGEADYLDVLGDLVQRYEDQAHPIGGAADGEMLAFLIDQRGVKQVDVARATGIAESTLSEVLRGKRELTRGQITKLAAYFHMGPGVFLRGEAAP
ncbi:MAG TPA: helix-turn-helix domain-containing protein [Gemmataceae bacterium]|jgi:HTH-type transcriptional regulator/antitoxin HigA|nr:helix-turn-helix domain-containing protein [Gemmataceae bacterium]